VATEEPLTAGRISDKVLSMRCTAWSICWIPSSLFAAKVISSRALRISWLHSATTERRRMFSRRQWAHHSISIHTRLATTHSMNKACTGIPKGRV